MSRQVCSVCTHFPTFLPSSPLIFLMNACLCRKNTTQHHGLSNSEVVVFMPATRTFCCEGELRAGKTRRRDREKEKGVHLYHTIISKNQGRTRFWSSTWTVLEFLYRSKRRRKRERDREGKARNGSKVISFIFLLSLLLTSVSPSAPSTLFLLLSFFGFSSHQNTSSFSSVSLSISFSFLSLFLSLQQHRIIIVTKHQETRENLSVYVRGG